MRWLLLPFLVACVSEAPEDTSPVVSEDTQAPTPPPRPVTERFEYVAPQLDLVFVVDADTWQDHLSLALDTFVADLEARDIDYRIAATGTYRDVDGNAGILTSLGPYRWADLYQPGAADIARGLMRAVDEDEDSETCGTLAVRDALAHAAPGGPNEGFFREGSDIAFVVVSDKSDRSFAHGFNRSAFVQYVRQRRDEGLSLDFHAIVDPHDKVGELYYSGVARSLEGCLYALAEPPLLPALACVSDRVEPHNVFPLTEVPIPGSVEVTVHEPGGPPVELDAEAYAYDEELGAVNLMDYYPRFKAEVEIRYLLP